MALGRVPPLSAPDGELGTALSWPPTEMSTVKTYSGAPYATATFNALQRRLMRNASHPPRASQPDALSLDPVALVPEIHLFLAEDPVLLWARLEADAGTRLGAPFWATAWSGGQVLARYVLDHPERVAGLRVLDFASGSGLVGIAAAMAGAGQVIANDVDGYAIAAIEANANANGALIESDDRDLTGGDGGDFDVILAADCLYSEDLAERVLPFLTRAAARGTSVLVGDPGRGHTPARVFETLATYHLPAMRSAEYGRHDRASVLTPALAVAGSHVQG
jgi:predicted nicotinamide N-methyase